MNVTTAGHRLEMALRRASKPHLSRYGTLWRCSGRDRVGMGHTIGGAYFAWSAGGNSRNMVGPIDRSTG